MAFSASGSRGTCTARDTIGLSSTFDGRVDDPGRWGECGVSSDADAGASLLSPGFDVDIPANDGDSPMR